VPYAYAYSIVCMRVYKAVLSDYQWIAHVGMNEWKGGMWRWEYRLSTRTVSRQGWEKNKVSTKVVSMTPSHSGCRDVCWGPWKTRWGETESYRWFSFRGFKDVAEGVTVSRTRKLLFYYFKTNGKGKLHLKRLSLPRRIRINLGIAWTQQIKAYKQTHWDGQM
jgi:hypothetical protein